MTAFKVYFRSLPIIVAFWCNFALRSIMFIKFKRNRDIRLWEIFFYWSYIYNLGREGSDNFMFKRLYSKKNDQNIYTRFWEIRNLEFLLSIICYKYVQIWHTIWNHSSSYYIQFKRNVYIWLFLAGIFA